MRISPADKALLITIFSASSLVLIFFFLTVEPYEDPIPETFFEIPVLAEVPKQEIKAPAPEPIKARTRSHSLYNRQKAANDFPENDPIREAIAQRQLASVSELEDINDESLEALRKARALARNADGKPDENKRLEAEKRFRESAANKKKTTISYTLKDRVAFKIPNPVYTCDALGTITISISVSAGGTVQKVRYDKEASTTDNGCLIDQALDYASRAVFNNGKPASQDGSITFDFQG